MHHFSPPIAEYPVDLKNSPLPNVSPLYKMPVVRACRHIYKPWPPCPSLRALQRVRACTCGKWRCGSHCRLFRPAYGRFGTYKKKESPLAWLQLNLVLAGVRTRAGEVACVCWRYVGYQHRNAMFMLPEFLPPSRWHTSTHRSEIEFRFATRTRVV